VPLTAVVDWAGVRVVATAVTPVAEGGGTLVYGRADAGAPFCSKPPPPLAAMLRRAGAFLALKPHAVEGVAPGGAVRTVVVPLSGEVAVHLCEDRRFYVLHTSRLLPPDAGAVGGCGGGAQPAVTAPPQLRAEFLRGPHVGARALSADALRPGAALSPLGPPDGPDNDVDACAAAAALRARAVPAFAAELEAGSAGAYGSAPISGDSGAFVRVFFLYRARRATP
jgi:hypothetical protein